MKTLIKTAAIATAISTATIAPVKAHAAIETLAECYQAVLTWCNETYPDMNCSQSSGLDDCDDVFGDQSGVKLDEIMILTYADGTKKLQFNTSPVDAAKEVDDRDERRDNDRQRPERDTSSGRGEDDRPDGRTNQPKQTTTGSEAVSNPVGYVD